MQRAGLCVAHHAARAHHVGDVGDFKCPLDQLLDQQDGAAGGPQLEQHVHHLVHDDGSQPEGRLVEHEQPRRAHQRLADGQHLLLSARERAGHGSAALLQDGEQAVDLVQALTLLRPADAGTVQPEVQVTCHRLGAKELAAFGHLQHTVIDDAPRRQRPDGGAVEMDRSALHGQQARDGLEQRALAGPVAAQQRDDLVLVHVDHHVFEYAHVPIAACEMLYRQQLPTRPRGRSHLHRGGARRVVRGAVHACASCVSSLRDPI